MLQINISHILINAIIFIKAEKKKNQLCNKDCLLDKCPAHNTKNKPDLSNYSLDSLDKYTVPQLKYIAKHNNIKKYSKLRKNDLIKLISQKLSNNND